MEKMLARIFLGRKQIWMLGDVLIIEQVSKKEVPVSSNPNNSVTPYWPHNLWICRTVQTYKMTSSSLLTRLQWDIQNNWGWVISDHAKKQSVSTLNKLVKATQGPSLWRSSSLRFWLLKFIYKLILSCMYKLIYQDYLWS